MDHKILIAHHDKILRQRNLFVGISSFLLLSNVFLSIKTYKQDQMVVMVPALAQEMSVSKSSISAGYLQEMSNLFLTNLLDLTPNTVLHKKQRVLQFTSESNFRSIEKYFQEQEEKINKFKIITYFTPKELDINQESMQVKVVGILTSHFGDQGLQDKEITCLLKFDYRGGILRLNEFQIHDMKK